MFKRTDALWMAAIPVYVLLGTARHEGSHALVAVMQGATIDEFVFWPTEHGWGYVTFSGGATTWLTGAAPFFIDLATFLLFLWPCLTLSNRHRWLWINCLAIGILSPVIDAFNNYRWGLRGGGDVGHLLDQLPAGAVHGCFAALFLVFALGFLWIFKRSQISAETRRECRMKRGT